MRQQQQQRTALSALTAWAVTGQHYRRRLLLRCVCGWRGAAAEGTNVLGAAAEAMRGLRQRQVVKAWWQYVQDQVGGTAIGSVLCLHPAQPCWCSAQVLNAAMLATCASHMATDHDGNPKLCALCDGMILMPLPS